MIRYARINKSGSPEFALDFCSLKAKYTLLYVNSNDQFLQICNQLLKHCMIDKPGDTRMFLPVYKAIPITSMERIPAMATTIYMYM